MDANLRAVANAPQGTVSFLFTDIVGSTRLWEKFPASMSVALARHDTLVRQAAQAYDGYIFKTVGDAFCVAFNTARDALGAAIQAQRKLGAEDWGELGPLLVRMGLHTGSAEFRDGDYFGGTLNRAARIEAAAHGGQILLSQVACELLADEPFEGVAFKSLGSHRLRNLDRPEHLFQVVVGGLPDSFPPPRSMQVLPNNLPAQATSFVGREHEIEEVKRLLQKTRLLTLTGTGGTGKTRLSLEAGAQLIDEFPDGVWLVELAPISEPERVIEVTAAALSVHGEPDRPLREALLQFLGGKNLLLVLDNCEHVLRPAADLAFELLRQCPQVKILATSRHSLAVPGEVTFLVPPLTMFDVRLEELSGPDIAERLSQYEAVRLFIERAAAVRPDFAVTAANAAALAEICSRLDGIPLAIELAAARVRVLSLDQISQRLDDRFRFLRGTSRTGALPHQQTLQALIDWSHDLLSEPERILFRRLGVFAGGRSLEALEAVCSDASIESFDILDLLQQLVDKSLVVVERKPGTPPRYTLIESVWQYAREKLEASGEANALRERHLEYFLRLAEQAAPQLAGPDQKSWLDLCQNEINNFRAAFRYAVTAQKTELGMRLFTALERFVEVRGHAQEALGGAERLLALPDGEVAPGRKAEFRVAVGRLCWAVDRYAEARKLYTEAQGALIDLGDAGTAALAEALTGFLDLNDGQLEHAERRFQHALEVGRQTGRPQVESASLSGLGSVALNRGQLVQAVQLKEQSLVLYRRLGDHWIVGLILWGIVNVAIAQKDHARARSALAEWTAITRQLGNRWLLAYILDCHARIALDSEDPRAAARCLGAAEALRQHFGMQLSPLEKSQHDAAVAQLRQRLSENELEALWEAGRNSPPWQLVGVE
jgi:predicted ATPase/class 3 adenylate cyclase